MTTKQDQLLQDIDPGRTLDETARRADEAIISFSMESAQVSDWDEFLAILVRFYNHVEVCILRVSNMPQVNLELTLGHCVRIFMKVYDRNGLKCAFEMARTGNEGGLYAVLKRMAQQLAEKHADNEISARICRYWNSLTMEEKISAPDEYMCKYGHLLPSELTEGSAGRIRANFQEVLRQHPRLMQRLSRIGRK